MNGKGGAYILNDKGERVLVEGTGQLPVHVGEPPEAKPIPNATEPAKIVPLASETERPAKKRRHTEG